MDTIDNISYQEGLQCAAEWLSIENNGEWFVAVFSNWVSIVPNGK